MSDEEFSELVSLFLDGEISPRDRLRLEEEVERSPGRRRAFREQCRLHEAMRAALLGESVGDGAEREGASGPAAPRSSASIWMGGAIAAAAGVLVLVGGLLAADRLDRFVERAQAAIAAESESAAPLAAERAADELDRYRYRQLGVGRRERPRPKGRASLAEHLRLSGLASKPEARSKRDGASERERVSRQRVDTDFVDLPELNVAGGSEGETGLRLRSAARPPTNASAESAWPASAADFSASAGP